MSNSTISIINGRIYDIAFENVFAGTLVREADGVRSVSVADGVSIKVAHGEQGEVSVAIDPQDIILSTGEIESSALNRCEGSISKIEETNGSLRVFVDVGVELCTVITRRSFDDMGLNIGKSVWATFKANAVKVIEDGR
jgi:molybdopterin-binding protein